MKGRIWVDGVEGAGLPADDPGFTRGWNAFETFRSYGNAPFRRSQHLDRLEESCRLMEIACPLRAQLEAELTTHVQANSVHRLTLTGGGHRVLHVFPVDERRIEAPVTCALMEFRPWDSLPGVVKHGSRAAWMLAARRRGVTEVIFTDGGFVLEANRSNVFSVVDGVIWTPPLDGRQLEGITRSAMLEAARGAGLAVREEPLPASTHFDELYLSSTLKELAPVNALDGRPGPGGGPVGRAMLHAFREIVASETRA